jgi:hypothetical protein
MILAGMEIVTTHAVADVSLNDIPTALVGAPDGFGRAFIPVPAYLVRGSNMLAARIGLVGEAQGKAEIRIAVFNDGDDFFSGAGTELVRLDWSAAEGTGVRSQGFRVGFGPERWAWHRCQSWDRPDQALIDAAGFVRELITAFFASDAAWFESAASAQFDDLAQAYSAIPADQLRQQIAGAIASAPPIPVTEQPPPVPVLFAENRLLGLFTADGEPYLRKPGDTGMAARALLGKLNGAWQIIR